MNNKENSLFLGADDSRNMQYFFIGNDEYPTNQFDSFFYDNEDNITYFHKKLDDSLENYEVIVCDMYTFKISINNEPKEFYIFFPEKSSKSISFLELSMCMVTFLEGIRCNTMLRTSIYLTEYFLKLISKDFFIENDVLTINNNINDIIGKSSMHKCLPSLVYYLIKKDLVSDLLVKIGKLNFQKILSCLISFIVKTRTAEVKTIENYIAEGFCLFKRPEFQHYFVTIYYFLTFQNVIGEEQLLKNIGFEYLLKKKANEIQDNTFHDLINDLYCSFSPENKGTNSKMYDNHHCDYIFPISVVLVEESKIQAHLDNIKKQYPTFEVNQTSKLLDRFFGSKKKYQNKICINENAFHDLSAFKKSHSCQGKWDSFQGWSNFYDQLDCFPNCVLMKICAYDSFFVSDSSKKEFKRLFGKTPSSRAMIKLYIFLYVLVNFSWDLKTSQQNNSDLIYFENIKHLFNRLEKILTTIKKFFENMFKQKTQSYLYIRNLSKNLQIILDELQKFNDDISNEEFYYQISANLLCRDHFRIKDEIKNKSINEIILPLLKFKPNEQKKEITRPLNKDKLIELWKSAHKELIQIHYSQ